MVHSPVLTVFFKLVSREHETTLENTKSQAKETINGTDYNDMANVYEQVCYLAFPYIE